LRTRLDDVLDADLVRQDHVDADAVEADVRARADDGAVVVLVVDAVGMSDQDAGVPARLRR